jgi:predicted nucleic acid-binding protein
VPIFVDTNVLVYARDSSEPDKQPLAHRWLESLWQRRSGRLSIQVLHEFYVTVTRKLEPGMPAAEARRDIQDLLRWGPLALDASLIESAWLLEDQHRIAFWDALIVAAARRSGCEHLLSEDLQDGQDFGGTRVLNPFLHQPAELDM